MSTKIDLRASEAFRPLERECHAWSTATAAAALVGGVALFRSTSSRLLRAAVA
ncbi:hypothetical protein HK104_009112, partial [Borealophlyctis nickersoniae]